MKRSLNQILLTLSLICFTFVMQAQISVSPTNLSQTEKLDGIQRLNFISNKGKYFLDKTPDFLVELPQNSLPASVTRMEVIINAKVYPINPISDVLIKGLPAGGSALEFAFYNTANKKVSLMHELSSKIKIKNIKKTPFFKNEAIVVGILICLLGLVFYTESSKKWAGFYRYVPGLLLCYFLPAILNSLGIISGAYSNLYYVASRFMLPASLILLCLSIDLKGVINLGPKALIMFFAATLGIIIGGPIAMLVMINFFPEVIPVDLADLWRAMSTVAGSWIGGGANQAAMKEIYEVPDNLFGTMIIVDVVVANIWMGFLLYGAKISNKIDARLGADNSAIEDLKKRVSDYRESIKEIPSTTKLFMLFSVAFGGVALAHWGADVIKPIMDGFEVFLKSIYLDSLMSGFFWLIVISTTIGVALSFTKARSLEGVGASRWGSIFIYFLVATIGMKMDLGEIWANLGLFAFGIIWMLVHVTVLLVTAKIIKAPFFFVAVGSQANVGGAASAPVVASAFSPALAPVGVLMAVLGYALGTFGAIACATIMKIIAGG